jgi:hypothetical protein
MARVELSGAGGAGLFIEIDDGDLPLVAAIRWYAQRGKRSRTIYAKNRIKGETIFVHRIIMAAQPGQIIDHIDGNGLNNRRENLRFVTHGDNIRHGVRLRKEQQITKAFDEWEHLL